MSFTSSSLALLKLYKSIWIIQTRYLFNPHAVQIRLFRVTLISDPAHDRFERSKNLGINFVRRRQTESTYDEIRNRDLDILARQCTQAYTLWLPPCACKTTRRWEEFHISAFDVFNRKNAPDTELFMYIKERYCKTKGIFGRFLSPRTVKGIWATDVRPLQVTNTRIQLTSGCRTTVHSICCHQLASGKTLTTPTGTLTRGISLYSIEHAG